MLRLPRSFAAPLLAIGLLAGTGCGAFGIEIGSDKKEPEFPPMSPIQPELTDRIHNIRDGMADFREMVNNKTISEGTLSRDDLRAFFDASDNAMSARERADARFNETALRLLHMLPPEEEGDDEDLQSASDFYAENIAGLYFFDEDRLLLIGSGEGDLRSDDELTLAHEYMHSFQDVTYDLRPLRKLQSNMKTEYPRTVPCVYEGDATFSSIAYVVSEYGPAWLKTLGSQEEPGTPVQDTGEGQKGSTAMGRYVLFNYSECADFVAAIFLYKGWDGVNALYKKPPSTTEQILHPEKYIDNEGAIPMTPLYLGRGLAKGWREIDEAPFGELDLQNYLLSLTEDYRAVYDGAEGWGAGWMTIYGLGETKDHMGATMLHMQFLWDGEDDKQEFLNVYGTALDSFVEGEPAVSDDQKTYRWQDGANFGSLVIGRGGRIDIIIATNEQAREDGLRTLANPTINTKKVSNGLFRLGLKLPKP